ncbi:UDP-3-O-acyl-N-acetylglucosamine deacetylase [Alphaproteobacteria bacterium SO-S41]|nr:UDP-3-O-acyl-N-acetylglucosamine deacetylase [Alphaproteobacteria bacterium SO-S41]
MKTYQTTIKQSVSCRGTGLHSGVDAVLTLHPAPAHHGIVFQRVDIGGREARVPARFDLVGSSAYGTTLRNDAGVEVRTVEHLMAALSAAGVDNLLVEIDGLEIPIMDGSSAAFVALIEAAGLRSQAATRHYIRVLRPVEVRDGDKIARLAPYDGFQIDCDIDFEAAAIARQRFVFEVKGDIFKNDVASARTFTQMKDVEALHARGLALGGSMDNAVVVDEGEVLNPEGLRFADECVRHKALDVLGDLALAGKPILGRFEGVKMGHTMNNRLLRALFADASAYDLVPAGAGRGTVVPMPIAASPA